MRILGISAFYHDSAAALIDDGHIISAAQEERFSRKKQDSDFPGHALAYCLAEAKCQLDDVDFVAFYDKPFLKFERLLETYLAFAPKGFSSFAMAVPVWLKEKLFQKHLLRDELKQHLPNTDVLREECADAAKGLHSLGSHFSDIMFMLVFCFLSLAS